jgi:hypothetical protein
VGHGPQKVHPLTGHRHAPLVGVLASCSQASRAVTQAHVGLPADVLQSLGVFFASQWQRPADLGGRAVRSGAFNQSLAGMGMTGLGHRPLLAPRTRGRLRGEQAHELHALSGMIKARQVAECRHGDDRNSARHAPQGLEGLDDRGQAPRLHVIVPCLFEMWEACGVCGNGMDLFFNTSDIF